MSPEFGAASQLEKIEMLDHADFIAVNKFDRMGGADAVRDVGKHWQRSHKVFEVGSEEFPVFGTVSSRFNDPGVTQLHSAVHDQLCALGLPPTQKSVNRNNTDSLGKNASIPSGRRHYLGEIAETLYKYRSRVRELAHIARQRQWLEESAKLLEKIWTDNS